MLNPIVEPICQSNPDSEESVDEDESAVQQEMNEAVAESPSLVSESSEVKRADKTNTESTDIIETLSVPDTFEDPHDCCAAYSPI